ncbi:MAG: hypothetical protein HFF45_01200 [Lawsonibacter sp.]|nr:hypothetical protein [Lawsonibacter sp.]
MAYTHLSDGTELQISEYVCFHSDRADISDLVILSPEELAQLEQDSVAQEKAIYNKILETLADWKKQAGKTLDLRKAQEYLKVRPVEHTSNRLVIDENGWHEISNMVYKFRWHTNEITRRGYDKKSVPVVWEVSWSLILNSTRYPDNLSYARRIAGQRDKRFSNQAEMEKYLQGRIAAYAHLFTEISPPIPEEHKRCFYVNSVLLPGYTVETPVSDRPDPDTVDDLLSYLDDDDVSALLQPEEQEPPAEALPPNRSPKRAPSHKQKRSAPTR